MEILKHNLFIHNPCIHFDTSDNFSMIFSWGFVCCVCLLAFLFRLHDAKKNVTFTLKQIKMNELTWTPSGSRIWLNTNLTRRQNPPIVYVTMVPVSPDYCQGRSDSIRYLLLRVEHRQVRQQPHKIEWHDPSQKLINHTVIQESSGHQWMLFSSSSAKMQYLRDTHFSLTFL